MFDMHTPIISRLKTDGCCPLTVGHAPHRILEAGKRGLTSHMVKPCMTLHVEYSYS